jgi:hypothetical protein
MSGAHEAGSRLRSAFFSLGVRAVPAATLRSAASSRAGLAARSRAPGSSLAIGSVGHIDRMDAQVVVDAAGVLPGGSRARTLTLTGTGYHRGSDVLAKSRMMDAAASPGPSSALVLTVQDVTAAPRIPSSTAAADPDLQGASTKLHLQLTGVTR